MANVEVDASELHDIGDNVKRIGTHYESYDLTQGAAELMKTPLINVIFEQFDEVGQHGKSMTESLQVTDGGFRTHIVKINRPYAAGLEDGFKRDTREAPTETGKKAYRFTPDNPMDYVGEGKYWSTREEMKADNGWVILDSYEFAADGNMAFGHRYLFNAMLDWRSRESLEEHIRLTNAESIRQAGFNK